MDKNQKSIKKTKPTSWMPDQINIHFQEVSFREFYIRLDQITEIIYNDIRQFP